MTKSQLYEIFWTAREDLGLKAELEEAAAMFKAEHHYLDTEIQRFIAPRAKAFEPATWHLH